MDYPFLIGLFVFLEWNRVSSLCILKIKPMSKISLANVFSYAASGSLFILLIFSLVMHKLFILMKCTVCGNADWCSHCGKQYGISSKK